MRKISHCLLVWIALWLPLAAFAQGGSTTYTSSVATGVGPTYANGFGTTAYIGPQTITIGNLGTCTMSPPGPYPNASCPATGGSGTLADPYNFVCSPTLTASSCTSGTPFVIAAGAENFDTLLYKQSPVGAPAAVPVPVAPWIPIGSAVAIVLLALAWRRRVASS